MLVSLLASNGAASADSPPADARAPAPNPAAGEPYDGRGPEPSAGAGLLWVPRIVLFPFRLLFWAIEPPTRAGVEFEQRHHLYEHLYAAFTSDDGQVGVRPTFVWMNSFRPSFGIHVYDGKLLGPGTKSVLDVSGGIDVVDAAIHLRPTHLGRRVHVFFDSIFDRRNDFLFAGIDSHAPLPAGAATRYQQTRLDEGARLDLRPTSYLAFTFGGYFGLRRFANGETYDGNAPIDQIYCVRAADGRCVPGTVDERQVPGFNQGTQFLRAAAGVHLDLRDDRVRPTLGALVDAEADYSHGLGDSDDSSYFRIRGAASVALNLWQHSHLLILRGATELVLPVENAAVPFSELTTLGGPEDLRGFRWQEFRGFSSLIATAEYRWPLLPWVDGAVFFDYGGVYGKRYDGFGAGQMQPDVGFALRLRARDRFYVKVQLARGFDGGGWRIYLTGQNLP